MSHFKDNGTLSSFSPVLEVLWSMPTVSSTNINRDCCQDIPLQPSTFTSVNTAKA